jgi:hypothetical protein
MPLAFELEKSMPNLKFNVSNKLHGEISRITTIFMQHPYSQFKRGPLLANTNY